MRDETVRTLAPCRLFFDALAPASLLEKTPRRGGFDAGAIAGRPWRWVNARLATKTRPHRIVPGHCTPDASTCAVVLDEK